MLGTVLECAFGLLAIGSLEGVVELLAEDILVKESIRVEESSDTVAGLCNETLIVGPDDLQLELVVVVVLGQRGAHDELPPVLLLRLEDGVLLHE